ncbi:aminoglycoside phosphotransferase family protein [Mesorhizobium marinum]|uniref:aminoglycoside phosphotransferase family protein n=1 Tax=Mesorhizobium marinum TaxID=3228790 RepID=UPI0034656635
MPFTIAGRGWHSIAVDVGGRFIAKFPEGEEAEEALRREASLLAAVRPRLTMAVPDMTLHQGPPLFSLHGKLPGATLDGQGYARLNEEARRRLADDIALFLAEMHAVDPAVMREAGALPVGWWDTADATLAPVWPYLPEHLRKAAQAAIADYRALPPDPLGEVYGYFDAHGWNMAFDHQQGRLKGIFDFADSGFGPPHRELVQISLVDADLAARTAAAYQARTGRVLDRRRIFLLAAAMRISELAGAIETDEHVDAIRGYVVGWLEQRLLR